MIQENTRYNTTDKKKPKKVGDGDSSSDNSDKAGGDKKFYDQTTDFSRS